MSVSPVHHGCNAQSIERMWRLARGGWMHVRVQYIVYFCEEHTMNGMKFSAPRFGLTLRSQR